MKLQTATTNSGYENGPKALAESVPAARASVIRNNLTNMSSMFGPGGVYSKPKEADIIQLQSQGAARHGGIAGEAAKAIIEKPSLQPAPPETNVVELTRSQEMPATAHLGDAMTRQLDDMARARSLVEAALRKAGQ